MGRPFRILIVDDEIDKALKIVAPDHRLKTIEEATCDHALWVLRELIFQTPVIKKVQLVIYLARDLLFTDDSVIEVTSTNEPWNNDFLWTIDELDVLVLDFGGLNLAARWYLEKGDSYVEGATEAQINELNGKYQGAAFYLKNRDRLAHCQAIIFFTQYDLLVSSDVINKFIKTPFCNFLTIPPVQMFSPRPEGINDLANKLKALYIAFAEGYTQLESLPAIDFAASHDMPVMIIGETGTGKEYIARQIHRRWRQEKNDPRIPEEPAIVNCAALDDRLARTELFGQIRGTYTGGDDHRIGAILTACGCTQFSSTLTGTKTAANNIRDFETGFESSNRGRAEVTRSGIEFYNQEPLGTLFLDEFGDLPASVQTMLLRYLQSKEVQPLGYPRVIKGANIRIIAATSDPRVAGFVGVQLYGGWRSRFEWERPLREDLIFRVKGQVIRTERITEANVEKALRHFVNQSGNGEKWTPGAYEYLIRKLKEQLTAIEKTVHEGKADTGQLPAFGHRRELDRIVKLANAFVTTANKRGLRLGTDEVTDKIIEIVWKPSAIFFNDPYSSSVAPESREASLSQAPLNDEIRVKADEVLDLIEGFFANRTPTLTSEWRLKSAAERRSEFSTLLKEMGSLNQNDQKEALKKMIAEKIRQSRSNGEALYKYLFGVSRGGVGKMFKRSEGPGI